MAKFSKPLHPKGYIPALELDDGEVLTENLAILSYIAKISSKLLPQTNILRWRTLEALAFMSTEIHGSYAPFFRNFPATEKERAREKLARAFSLLDNQLDDKKYLICEEITIADFYLFWVLMASERTGIQLTQSLQSYFARMKLLPSVELALNEEGIN
ncbi:TPA: glutathione S-transferase family protein [Klebsiella pneumoniae]|uniref:glutathione binding-like protein n=1 Tax=Klebsiella pneumoniae TaxID=573 RepID=UPI00289624B7|nr:glutathione binding-like protein [Klebsiella pneumoniae]MEA4717323.1 glutathione binding-like protein [Klebsiella pneumoniae]HBQ3174666.1 glutathione S-transferase family protein [Klebsiella pneumoniae]HBS7359823.1 glutathione S-transferase family protein [Klebsiella pneumoniae]HCF8380464.1 glutathione S-transferase family protein [Klebsiella pneumoniae]